MVREFEIDYEKPYLIISNRKKQNTKNICFSKQTIYVIFR